MRFSRFLVLAALLAAPFVSLSGAAENHILVHGHRGARARRPENTIPAFKYAISEGVDALELDLAVTKDNVLVVSHDPMINDKICSGGPTGVAIHTLTLAEVKKYDCGSKRNPLFSTQIPVPGTTIPTFDEVLDLAPLGNFDFNVETKISPSRPELTPSPEEFVQLMLVSIRKHNVAKRIILQSFDFRTLHAMKALEPEIRLSALYSGKPKDFVAIAKESGAGIISPEQHLVTPEQVSAAHADHLEVVPWTADTPAEWDKLIAAHVDAIISDDPAALLHYLKSRGLH